MAKARKVESEKVAESLERQAKDDPLGFRLAILVEKANRSDGSPSDEINELRQFLDDNPDIWKRFTSYSGAVKIALQSKVSGEHGNREILDREYIERRNNLGWAEATTLERLLIERIMLCWLRLLWVENYNASFMRPEVSMRESEYADRLLDRAHSRYVKACESLAKMRAMLLAADLLREKSGKPEGAEKPKLALASGQ
jgi:hypothetical protein